MSRARVRVAAVSGVLVLALAGCGAGQTASTAQDLPSVPGVNLDDSGIGLRNAVAVFAADGYQPGDTVPVTLAIVNQTDQDTRLTELSSADAESVTLDNGGAGVAVPAFGLVPVTLQVTGIRAELGATGSVPLELAFANGATFSLNVPMAPPLERAGVREPLSFDEDH